MDVQVVVLALGLGAPAQRLQWPLRLMRVKTQTEQVKGACICPTPVKHSPEV